MTARRWAAVAVLGLAFTSTDGCVGTTGHLAAASTRDVEPRDLFVDTPPRHVVGRSCIDVVVVFPARIPNIGEAIEDALRKGGGRVLTEVTIRYELVYLPLVYGTACYVAEGAGPVPAAIFVLAAACGCAVDVASLRIATPGRLSPGVMRMATSRGWREGESCRFWLLGVPFGLPQVDEAMNEALRPVGGAFMRDATVFSVHPVYVLFGWHCYRVRGEVFG